MFSFWRTHWHWPAESHWRATTKKDGFLAPCGSTLGRRLEAQRVAYSRPQLAEWTRVARIRGARKNAKISEIQRLPSPCWSADSCDPSLCAGRLPSAGMLRPLAGRTVTTNKVWQGVGWGLCKWGGAGQSWFHGVTGAGVGKLLIKGSHQVENVEVTSFIYHEAWQWLWALRGKKVRILEWLLLN